MANWTRIAAPARGAFSSKMTTSVGGILTALLLFVTFVAQMLCSTTPTAPESVTVADKPAGPQTAVALDQRVQDITQRAEMERAQADRSLSQSREDLNLSAGQVTPAYDLTTGAPLDAGGVLVTTEAEAELREQLRLEAIERQQRSIRSEPVAISYRSPSGDPAATAAAGTNASTPAPANPPTIMDTLAALTATADALDAQGGAAHLDAAAQAGAAWPSALPVQAAGDPPQSPLGPAGGATVPRGDPLTPAIVRSPDTPPGWERIYEGTFLEAVLVNQLNGDFPGPVLASVSVPYYSADRQRIVIPRGSRVVGAASAVGGQDQERLAVGFHRLIYPDGRWVSLDFTGMNQVGEGALKDQVNRHYLAMFASVGAVGIISGLTLRGSNPYAGGAEGFRAGAGQGLAQGATQILGRFLNRLPTLTIRAGHRLRIWLTSDVLVPRPTIGQR